MIARLAFLDEAQRLLPHVFRDYHTHTESLYPGHEIAEEDVTKQRSAASVIEAKMRSVFGEAAEMPFREASNYRAFQQDQETAQAVHRASKWARARAARCQFLAGYKPMNGFLSAEYGFDGEIPRRLASVLVARRDAWLAAGKPLTDTAWRTVQLRDPVVRLDLPRGAYSIFREAVISADTRGDFAGAVMLDERLATRGGLFRVEPSDEDESVWRLVGLEKKVSVWVVARAIIREQGKFCAKEVVRRLREGVKPTFKIAGSHRRWGRRDDRTLTEVSISGGKRDPNQVRELTRRAERYLRLAEWHDGAVAKIQESARQWARDWAAEAAMVAHETQSRYVRARGDFEGARERYNRAAFQFCLKRELDGVPFEVPPERFPSAKASLCDRDARHIRQAEAAFRDTWREFSDASAGARSLGLRVSAPSTIRNDAGAESPLPPDQMDFGIAPDVRRVSPPLHVNRRRPTEVHLATMDHCTQPELLAV